MDRLGLERRHRVKTLQEMLAAHDEPRKQRQRRHRGGTMSERPLPIEVRPGATRATKWRDKRERPNLLTNCPNKGFTVDPMVNHP
jgi:hypothetical protein